MRSAFAESAPLWYRDRAAWSFIVLRYAPLLGLLNLLWESAQLPFYTLWQEAPASFIAYSVVHCTLGDVAIGTLALAIALIATQARNVEIWRLRQVALILVLTAVGYTAFSEWMNTVARTGWAYSELMPIVRLNGLAIGLSPLLQWLVIPPAALLLAANRYVRLQ
ncbi:MAG: hypothetical protein HYY79_11995 [Betaproteobacteria bacterium]|nr:hypothetical protein [Betaproteobacteria bacterium]